MAFYKCI
jgi:hypothetical protein